MMTCSVVPKSPQKASSSLASTGAVQEDHKTSAEKKKVPLEVKASWQAGKFVSPEVSLPAGAADVLSSHCPLILAAATFCQTFQVTAEKDYISVKSIKATASTEVNLTSFYKGVGMDLDARDPWQSVKLVVDIDADVSHEELQMTAEDVLKACPINELLKEHFCVEVALTVDTIEEGETDVVHSISDHHDVEGYRRVEVEDEFVPKKKQSVLCVYHTNSDHLNIHCNGVNVKLSNTETVPVGDASTQGMFTPVQAFLFGCTCYYMKTFTLRLALQGYGLNKLIGTLKTTFNNGVKYYDDGLDPTVFSVLGGSLHLDVKSDAPKGGVEKAFLETQSMDPTYLLLAGSADTELTIQKV